MGSRKVVDVQSVNPTIGLQKYVVRESESSRIRSASCNGTITTEIMRGDMDRNHAELIKVLNSLEHSLDGMYLHPRSKDNSDSRRFFQELEDKLSEKWVKPKQPMCCLF